MNKKKITIIFIVFLSLLLLRQFFRQWCEYSFRSLTEIEEELKINTFQYEDQNVPEFARQDFLLFMQQINADEEKIFSEKKIYRLDLENLEENIKILKNLKIWDRLFIEPGVTFEEYYHSIQDSQKAFRFQLDKLLEKVEEEKNLESFREELKKLREKHQKDIDVFADFIQRINEEVLKTPTLFFDLWKVWEDFVTSFLGTSLTIFLTSFLSRYRRRIGFQR